MPIKHYRGFYSPGKRLASELFKLHQENESFESSRENAQDLKQVLLFNAGRLTKLRLDDAVRTGTKRDNEGLTYTRMPHVDALLRLPHSIPVICLSAQEIQPVMGRRKLQELRSISKTDEEKRKTYG
jgi:hypothetical protein